MKIIVKGEIKNQGNVVYIIGELNYGNFLSLLSAIYKIITQSGYLEVVLDFTNCTKAFSGPMLALCAQVLKYQIEDKSFSLILPKSEKTAHHFKISNWAFIIDPKYYSETTYKGYKIIPALRFRTGDDQYRIVNRILDGLLSSVKNIKQRSDLASIEWAINEVTDNVLNHSESSIGGLVQVHILDDYEKIEFSVSDAGLGVAKTLRSAYSEYTTDLMAIDKAIREGVTRNSRTYQGNGLFGTFEISRLSEGVFSIHTNMAQAVWNPKQELHIYPSKIPFNGTLISSTINYSKQGILEKALKFDGNQHSPFDYIESKYEGDSGEISFKMKSESLSFGTRDAGRPIYHRIENLINLSSCERVTVDFADISIIGSSFADEVFGKLFINLGPMKFMNMVRFKNTNEIVNGLIDRAIKQRISSSM